MQEIAQREEDRAASQREDDRRLAAGAEVTDHVDVLAPVSPTIDEDRQRLEAALARLSARDRLLIRLRYQQNLTLKEVARLARLGDPFRARRRIQAALKLLTEFLGD